MSNVSSDSGLGTVPGGKVPPAPQVTWGPRAAIVVSVLAVVGGMVVAGILVYVIAALTGKNAEQVDIWLNSITGQFIFILLGEALTIAAVAWFLHRRKTSLKALGYQRGPRLTDVGLAVLAFVVYFVTLIVVTALAQALLNVNVDQKQELGFDNLVSSTDTVVAFISLVILPPLVEETLFRGFLYTGLRKKLSFVGATIMVSILFASLHLFASSEGLLWIAGIDTLILSFFLCYLREKTGSLWAPIMVHAIKNSLAFTFLYVVAAVAL